MSIQPIDYSSESKLLPVKDIAFNELKTKIVEEFGPNAADDKKIKRFLHARDYKVDQAHIMLKKNLEWREEHHMDTILQDYHPSEVYKKFFAGGFIGFDKEGSPVLVINFGKIDHKGFAKSSKKEEFIHFFSYIVEDLDHKLEEHAKEIGQPVESWTLIYDMEDFTLSQTMNKNVLERGIALCLLNDAHYPERLKCFYAINTSIATQILFSMIKTFIASRTQEKMKFFGNDGWKEKLLKIIDPEILPAYLGGNRTDPDGNPRCHSIIPPGGPIPEKFYMKNLVKSRLKDQPGVESLIVKRRSKFELPFHVPVPGSVIKWDMETDNYDIAFGLFHKSPDTNGNGKLVPLIPLQRFDSHLLRETGEFKCKRSGTYVLMLDNSFSILRSKTIYYKTSLIKPSNKIEAVLM